MQSLAQNRRIQGTELSEENTGHVLYVARFDNCFFDVIPKDAVNKRQMVHQEKQFKVF